MTSIKVYSSIEYKLGMNPYDYMDKVQNRPCDTYGPNLSWNEFRNLKKDLEDVLDRLLDQRDELIDQINILQAKLLKHGIPLPPVPGV